MTDKLCLNEEQMLDLFYGEMEVQAEITAREHIAACADCRREFANVSADLTLLDESVPDGGHRALEGALTLLGIAAEPVVEHVGVNDDFLTPLEVAHWLKVTESQVLDQLHAIPHFIFAGEIRIRKEALLSYIRSQEMEVRDRQEDIHPNPFLLRDVI